jgi:hypothetical protein
VRIDPAVCQKILVAVEGHTNAGTGRGVTVTVEGYEPKVIGQRIYHLVETGMLKGIAVTNMQSPHPEYMITDITPNGRAYLDSLEEAAPEASPEKFGFS